MMNSVFFDHSTIDRWINEDAALLDLTSHMLDVGSGTATIDFVIRHEGVAACTEEVQRILEHCGAQSHHCLPSGTTVKAGDILVSGQGPAHAVLRAWKVGQNLLEYACGVARLWVVQFDKVQPKQLMEWVPQLRQDWPKGVILAAGGIKLENIAQYAQTQVDGLVTSALHYAPPADIGVIIKPLQG